MLQSARNMTTQEIEKYLGALNDELNRMGVKGEIYLYSGAVMCLVYQARPSTKDVDAVFQPRTQMREAAERGAQVFGLRSDWLNDAVKGFVVEHPQGHCARRKPSAVPSPQNLRVGKFSLPRLIGGYRGQLRRKVSAARILGDDKLRELDARS